MFRRPDTLLTALPLLAGLVLVGPARPAAAATEDDLLTLFPQDSLLCIAWNAPDEQARSKLEQLRRMLDTLLTDEAPDWAPDAVALAIGVLTSPGGVVLIDVDPTTTPPDVQAGLIVLPAAARRLGALLDRTLPQILGRKPEPITIGQTQLSVARAGPVELVWGTRGDHVLLALGRQAAGRLLARIDGNGPSLADSEELAFDRRKLATGGQWQCSGFFNVKRLLERSRDVIDTYAPAMFGMFDQITAALGCEQVRSAYCRGEQSAYGPCVQVFVHAPGPQPGGLLRLWDQPPLRSQDLALIPRDAYWAAAFSLEPKRTLDDVLTIVAGIVRPAAIAVQSTIEHVEAGLPVAITRELLPALGPRWIVYDAPSHGGIALTGTVLVTEVRDPDAVEQMLGRLIDFAADKIRGKRAKLLVRQRDIAGHRVHYLVAAGISAPVVPAWGYVDGRLVVGLFPQTVAAALRHVDPQTRGPGLLDDPDVASAVRELLPQQMVSFAYLDSRWFTRSWSYPLTRMFNATGQNMLAGFDPQADPGAFPLLDEVLEAQGPSLAASGRDADGIRYAFVGTAQQLGLATFVGGLSTSILVPSLSRARELAKRAASGANLRAIGYAANQYADDHDGRLPDSLEQMVELGLITRETLNSPRDEPGRTSYVYLPQVLADAPWGRLLHKPGGMSTRWVLAYERFIGDEGTNVVFVDGVVRWMKLPDAKAAIRRTCEELGRADALPPELRGQ